MLRKLINSKSVKQLFLLCFLVVLASVVGCSDGSVMTTKESDNSTIIEKASVGGNVYERPHSPHIGPVDAKVTIVEFFDPACEACRAYYQIVKEIVTRHSDDVRLVLRYAAFHRGSETVIRMLEAAREQNIFGPVLEALLKDQDQWASHQAPNLEKAWDIAKIAGLNVELAKSAINSQRISSVIEQENIDIRELKIQRTPTFFVNNKLLTSFDPQELYKLVLSEMNR